MLENAVLTLRAQRLARATRPFLARGNRVVRCQRCLLPVPRCLCQTITPVPARSQFCLVMFDTEPMKPSNTGRLIADILPGTTAFEWSRTAPPQPLLDAVNDPRVSPLVVFPGHYAAPGREVMTTPPRSGKPPLFIMLDGTWTEAAKMFRKSPWLDKFPVMSLNVTRPSDYSLRESPSAGQHCTAEIAIALLEQSGDSAAASGLLTHFENFRQRYLAGKPSHQASLTKQQPQTG
ncbi:MULTISPECIES: tRNA-uridine aminocarboxypropyltransferase [unclassified Tatumella]|uniref:tRNA-uridine aminocarboxypropyltransferase n=1 Tax=unclassified Tatumella TaxID=2649542 RepID=UPI001BB036BF|nr:MULTISPECIES: tRNA-uridine aminocarboxypropyltransferase [unclassified Tatumella]MBS0857043.1 DTW domain-containing protein [Tatumella sp. JGM16]MBS0878307.1 DTW domain-containing protein [Tatumella sp. JGM82]MBS0891796.1 DTW domain-containing protein [Tatumella sp. JGM94]MBS0894649.1 DTW domain-containing protein [Tatumella sp. JGM130]MBS0903071.1 DTW domain-containing protein [Tatumella sp. JGM100]